MFSPEWHQQQPYPSHHLVDKAFLARLKPGSVLINAARGGIINEQDLLDLKKPLVYCTDVYTSIQPSLILPRFVPRILLAIAWKQKQELLT